MADEQPQGQEETSWWAVDAFTESSLPSATFDEPLVWPEALAWDDLVAPGTTPAADGPLPIPDLLVDLDAAAIFSPEPEIAAIAEAVEAPQPAPPPAPPAADLDWQEAGADPDATMIHDEALGGLGGGAASVPESAPGGPVVHEPLLESIWAALPPPQAGDDLLLTTTIPAPTVFAMTEGGIGARPPSRGSGRRGNIAVVALISLASLVLLGMFLSVRSRDDVPTDASQSRTPTTAEEIAVTGALNTIPLTTTVTTQATAPGINIGDLVPSTVTAGTPPAAGATATTAAPTRATTPNGGGSAATPATQPAPATTVAPAPATTTPATTTPSVTFPPVDDTTSATTPRRSTSTPTFPTSSVPTNTTPSYTIPPFTIPPIPVRGT